jgi:hypothetical protein
MKLAITAVAASASLGLALGLGACGSGSSGSAAVQHPAPSSPPTRAPATAPPTTTPPPSPSTPAPPAPQSPATQPNVTNPWAVVSAYYGDIESRDYPEAWALINSGATTGQTYQQFVNGFACTGQQQLTELSESGDQVTFGLAATNSCNGQVVNFTGTDTVMDGKIVAANVVQNSG